MERHPGRAPGPPSGRAAMMRYRFLIALAPFALVLILAAAGLAGR